MNDKGRYHTQKARKGNVKGVKELSLKAGFQAHFWRRASPKNSKTVFATAVNLTRVLDLSTDDI
jgi:hypothetical protein